MAEPKKVLKIIFINLIIVILVGILIEFIAFTYQPKEISCFQEKYNDYASKHSLAKQKPKYNVMVPFSINKLEHNNRTTLIGKSSKKPILLFGCSFTYGTGLNDNQTLSYKLYKLTDRTIYNKGMPATGTQHILYLLSQKSFYNKVPDVEFIIYTFIHDHLTRLYGYYLSPYSNDINLRYELKNGKLQEIYPRFIPLYSLYSVKRVQDYIKMQKMSQNDKAFKLFAETLMESKKLTDRHYPNSKFIILLYKDASKMLLDKEQIKLLESKGFIVIDAEQLVHHELTSDKYKAGDKEHPSEKAWDEIAPQLVKKLNI